VPPLALEQLEDVESSPFSPGLLASMLSPLRIEFLMFCDDYLIGVKGVVRGANRTTSMMCCRTSILEMMPKVSPSSR